MTKMACMPIYGKNLIKIFSSGTGGLISIWSEASGTHVKVTFYLDQHDLNQRSFIKDQISGERSHDLYYRTQICVAHIYSSKEVFHHLIVFAFSFRDKISSCLTILNLYESYV